MPIYTPCAVERCPLYVEDDGDRCPDHVQPVRRPLVGRWVDDLADADHLHDGDHVERARRRIEDVLARLPRQH